MSDISVEIEGLTLEQSTRVVARVAKILEEEHIQGAEIHVWDLPPLPGAEDDQVPR